MASKDEQAELDGMPQPAGKVYLSGAIGAPEGFLDGITKSKIGEQRQLVINVELVAVGDQKQQGGRGHFARFAAVELVSIT